MYIQYKRKVEFFASHFNETNYPRFESLSGGRWIVTDELVELLKDIHGHNFKAEVELMAHVNENYSSYILSDEAIVEIVNQWAGINLSVHNDFRLTGIRATTENMAQVLCKKIHDAASDRKGVIDPVVNVTIYESDDISSTAVRTVHD